MYLSDYHLHTEYSYDSCEKMSAVCEKAISAGMSEIAFTDHVDICGYEVYDQRIDLNKREKEISRLQEKYLGKLVIKNGIELGQPQANPHEAERFYSETSFDFILGSIHNLKNDVEVSLLDFNRRDRCNNIIDSYIDSLTQLALGYDFDVLAHITFPYRYLPPEDF